MLALLLCLSLAGAQEEQEPPPADPPAEQGPEAPPVEPQPPATPEPPEGHPGGHTTADPARPSGSDVGPDLHLPPPPPSAKKWSGIVLPAVSFNSTDKLSVGAGGELFQKGADGNYIRKIAFQMLFAVNGNLQSHLFRYDTRTGGHDLLIVLGFRMWKNMRYAGSGAEDVLVDWGDEELGNKAISPFFSFGVTHPYGIGFFYTQIYGRYSSMESAPGSLLEQRDPVGVNGAVYADLQVGYMAEVVDRWPLPNDGWRAEADLRFAGTWAFQDPGMKPSIAGHAEVTAWYSLAPPIVVAARLVASQAMGERAFFEEEFVGGRRRFEIGNDKSLGGYGRTRTRGTGVLAATVDLRIFLARTKHKFFDIAFYLDGFVEDGFLMNGVGLGPHMPTIGGGPILLWQGGTLLRPYVALGWRTASFGGDRYPDAQFGLALEDSL